MQLLVQNTVEDFDHWKKVFDRDGERAATYGLAPVAMWRSVDEPNEVFFLIDVEDRERAEAFMAAPESAAAGVESRVTDGRAWFVEPVG